MNKYFATFEIDEKFMNNEHALKHAKAVCKRELADKYLADNFVTEGTVYKYSNGNGDYVYRDSRFDKLPGWRLESAVIQYSLKSRQETLKRTQER